MADRIISEDVVVSVADLGTERGICDAAVKMARATCTGGLFALVEHTPMHMRQTLFERFFSALAGAMCAEVGPDITRATMDAVKLAIDDVQRERENAN